MSRRIVLRDVEVQGVATDVQLDDGVVTTVATAAGALEIDGHGGALLPGLHDHHLHLLAMAATRRSVVAGPPAVTDEAGLLTALTGAAARGGWVRATGYHESVAGDLDRDRLDALRGDVAVRVQHRSGALWVLNSRGLARLGDLDGAPAGLERDARGRPTGRLWRLDPWLGERLRADGPDDADVGADLAATGRQLRALGITGVTDATPDLESDALAALGAAVDGGVLPHPYLLGAPDGWQHPGVGTGARKILLPDHDLPDLAALTHRIATAHAAGRPVAVHVVTRVALVLTLAALDDAGVLPGDRLEHAAVVPPELVADLHRLGLAVVTQPGFLADRGDRYRRDVDPEDQPCLYRYAGLLARDIPVAASSDAPFGPLDPWAVLRAARDRRAPDGSVLGAEERVPPGVALAGYLSAPGRPGGSPRRVAPGQPADLVLLDAPLHEVLADPDAGRVRLTVQAGEVVHGP